MSPARASIPPRSRWPVRKVAALAAGLALCASGCSGGREARLQEVLRRSRSSPATISSLEKPFLGDSEADVRALAVWAIGDARAPDALEVLSPLANDPEGVVRLAVVRALCPMQDETAPDALVPLAQDPDLETRRAAVRCLAAKPSPAPGVLAAALADNDREVRVAALDALQRRPQRDAMEPLLAAVTTRGTEEQLAAVAALRALGDPAAVPALERAASERLAPAVRDAVEGAIIDLRRVAEEPPAAAAPEDGARGADEPGGTVHPHGASGASGASGEKEP